MWPWLKIALDWLIRLLGGWLPLGSKPLSEWAGKLIFAVGTSVLVFFLLTNFSGCRKKVPLPKEPEQTAGGSIIKAEPRFGCVTINMPKDKRL